MAIVGDAAVPIPIVPEVILDAFIFVIPEPSPEKLVADIVVPVKIPDNEPPLVGKKFDKVDAKVTPFLYTS